MSPKEKAKEIITNYYSYLWEHKNIDGANISFMNVAKQCSLIAVDEILKRNEPIQGKFWDYWEEVKQEIEKL
jgi:hypothetical protein